VWILLGVAITVGGADSHPVPVAFPNADADDRAVLL
jgi:hypothetical protein